MKKLLCFQLLILFCLSSSVLADEKLLHWVKESDHAQWQARDSQGELVYKNQLWLFGGWFGSYEAPPRDVWNSKDGKNWNLVEKNAPWIHSDLPMSVTFQNKMWMMGGWYNGRLDGHSASNQVWSSQDGKNWKQITAYAGWSPRVASGIVNFKGKMWILGGTENYYFGTDHHLKNDVWFSGDGKKWELATANAGWSPRSYHAAVVHDGKMWVMGGGNYVPGYKASNDVWCSEDGVHWKEVTKAAPWHERLWFSAVSYRNHMWVLGGWSKNPSKNWGDVWYSKDGKKWTELKTETSWKERHEHSALVFQDKIWVFGGHARPLSNEVWSLKLPKKFPAP